MPKTSVTTTGSAGLADAARELYEAELAYRDARQSGATPWIAAAADHLHRADDAYLDALAAAAASAA